MSQIVPQAESARALNIGIYGCPEAGKTRFLFQLLNGWHCERRLTGQSRECRTFLETVEGEIERYGNPTRTKASSEGISVTVSRDGKPPWELTFRDLSGELLVGSIDELGDSREGCVARQVSDCNAFLFFFDPTSAGLPSCIDQHYRNERDRAENFIRYVLRTRQNENLPIVFVQTRLDLWEDDAGIQSRAKGWFEQVNKIVADGYKASLKRHYPPCLADPVWTTIVISSVRDNEVERVVERLDRLSGEVHEFRCEDRRKSWGCFLAGIAVVALFVLLIILSKHIGPPPSPPNGGDWSLAGVREGMDQLDEALEKHPTDNRLATPEEIKNLHNRLLWLTAAIQRMDRETSVYPVELRDRAAQSWQHGTRFLRDKIQSDGGPVLPERLASLAAYLDDLQEPGEASDDLAVAQKQYWELHRRYVVERLAATFEKHSGASSDHATVLTDVRRQMHEIELEARGRRVRALEAQASLLGELQIVATFCQNIEKAGVYPATMKVVSAQLVCPYGISPSRRRLTLQSSSSKSQYVDLQVRLRASTHCDLQPPETPLNVKLALGNPGSLALAIYSETRAEWDTLFEFPLDVKDEAPSVRVLGMPLLRLNPSRSPTAIADSVTRTLNWNGYDLKIEFSVACSVPPLLLDALSPQRPRQPSKT